METEEENNLNTLDPERERQILRTLSIHHFSKILEENERLKMDIKSIKKLKCGYITSSNIFKCYRCKKFIKIEDESSIYIKKYEKYHITICENCINKPKPGPKPKMGGNDAVQCNLQ